MKVYAVESMLDTQGRLLFNCDLNGFDDFTLIPCAAWDEESSILFHIGGLADGRSSALKNRDKLVRRVMTTRAVRPDNILPYDDRIMMKIDNEGAEWRILKGSLKLIRSGKVSHIILEWSNRIYQNIQDLSLRFAFYKSVGDVFVIRENGLWRVEHRRELPTYGNLLIRVRK